MRTVRRTAAFAVVALLVAACGSDTTSTSTPTTGGANTTATLSPEGGTATTASPGTSAAGGTGFSATPVSVAPNNESAPALLSEIRVAAQDAFDRVTFEFTNHLPGYTVGYEDRPVIQDGSGAEVVVEGSAVLAVRMAPASGVDLSAGGAATYTGPDRLSPGTPALVELVRTGDFEGHLTWVVGVAAETGFKVSTLDSPPRLVVDIEYG